MNFKVSPLRNSIKLCPFVVSAKRKHMNPNPPKASQRAVLITGCSSGIGRYCALTLREKGFRVIASCRQPKDVQALEQQGLECVQLDVRDSASITRGLNQALELTHGHLYGLFNNAGFGQPGAVEDLSREAIRAQFETNVFGLMELTNHVIPIMRAHGGGRIIHNSSVLGLVTLPFRGAYNASKFALEGLADTQRMELRDTAIKISLIEPGPITSHFRENAYQQFLNHIDKKNSPYRKAYARFEKRFKTAGKEASFTLGPEAVFKVLFKALTASHPKHRYYVTVPTYFFGFMKRILSDRLLERLLMHVTKEERHSP